MKNNKSCEKIFLVHENFENSKVYK